MKNKKKIALLISIFFLQSNLHSKEKKRSFLTLPNACLTTSLTILFAVLIKYQENKDEDKDSQCSNDTNSEKINNQGDEEQQIKAICLSSENIDLKQTITKQLETLSLYQSKNEQNNIKKKQYIDNNQKNLDKIKHLQETISKENNEKQNFENLINKNNESIKQINQENNHNIQVFQNVQQKHFQLESEYNTLLEKENKDIEIQQYEADQNRLKITQLENAISQKESKNQLNQKEHEKKILQLKSENEQKTEELQPVIDSNKQLEIKYEQALNSNNQYDLIYKQNKLEINKIEIDIKKLIQK
jgi:hypothetical protein